MEELILKLTLAHLLGDFVLQTNSMVESIRRQKFASGYLYLHAGIHFALVIAFLEFRLKFWLPALLLALSHLAIDSVTKILLRKKLGKITNLVLDQMLHAVAIALFIGHFYPYKIDFDVLFGRQMYLLAIALTAITFVSAILVKKIMEALRYPFPNDGLADAGKWIGMLERLFIFAFAVNSFWEGVGFLLAAKSIFRFGDLKEKKDIKLTEYILIGTLLSFGLAMLIAMGYVYFS